ncbi:hypothetical protein Goshw_014516, partial [Gossypium schwendimanii]|nr:hypothetical protein [Gossypium laxum]MBA0857602.1 hypothetical protein [Gossypium schwendimanii]
MIMSWRRVLKSAQALAAH